MSVLRQCHSKVRIHRCGINFLSKVFGSKIMYHQLFPEIVNPIKGNHTAVARIRLSFPPKLPFKKYGKIDSNLGYSEEQLRF